MEIGTWIKEFPAAVVVCDNEGKIMAMNDRACNNYAGEGGIELVGKSIFDCHPEQAAKKLRVLFMTRMNNCYTVEKNGAKKLVYQAPWYEEGEFGGFVELAIDIPSELPHFIRKS